MYPLQSSSISIELSYTEKLFSSNEENQLRVMGESNHLRAHYVNSFSKF